jgi:hypothetical protein
MRLLQVLHLLPLTGTATTTAWWQSLYPLNLRKKKKKQQQQRQVPPNSSLVRACNLHHLHHHRPQTTVRLAQRHPLHLQELLYRLLPHRHVLHLHVGLVMHGVQAARMHSVVHLLGHLHFSLPLLHLLRLRLVAPYPQHQRWELQQVLHALVGIITMNLPPVPLVLHILVPPAQAQVHGMAAHIPVVAV